MTPKETVMLVRYVKACCPQQQIDEYTPDAWHDLLGDLAMNDCREAVKAVTRRQPFVAPAEIRAEVRRIRDDRLSRQVLPAPPPELADEPGRYQAALAASIQRIADGHGIERAIGAGSGQVRDGEPPTMFAKVRDRLRLAAGKLTPQETAARQADEFRKSRGGGREPAA